MLFEFAQSDDSLPLDLLLGPASSDESLPTSSSESGSSSPAERLSIESSASDQDFLLDGSEVYWREHYQWFWDQGYELRARYSPKWEPSWRQDGSDPEDREDSLVFTYRNINDAVRRSDRKHVVLKKIRKSDYPQEVSILGYFSQENLASQPENHCVPLLEILHPPGDTEHDVVVLPILREYDSPDFDTIGEAVDFIRQLLEGFAFLHEHRVAHRDVKAENVMMDPEALKFDDFHLCKPEQKSDLSGDAHWRYTRTEHRPKYYIIDFGYSTKYNEEDMPPFELPLLASDGTLPELRTRSQPCNPFPADVYYVGNLLRMDFLDGHGEINLDRSGRFGFEFLRPLVEAMTKEDPEERITMKDAAETFDSIVGQLGAATLRSRVVPKPGRRFPEEGFIQTISKSTTHWCRRVKYIAKRLPPIPTD